MLIFNKKKKNLNNIYNKIVEESKVCYNFLYSKRSDADHSREVFQLNLILILWYMKTKNISQNYLEYLIKIFIKDLEGMVIELGGSETSLRKKIRKLIENFYGRLYAFSEIFDNFENGGKNKLKDVINKNLERPLVTDLMINHLRRNYNHLKKLDEKDFWKANLFKNQ